MRMKKNSLGMKKKKKKQFTGVRIAETKICKVCYASFIPDDDEECCCNCINEFERRK
jgi:hypothetical protein